MSPSRLTHLLPLCPQLDAACSQSGAPNSFGCSQFGASIAFICSHSVAVCSQFDAHTHVACPQLDAARSQLDGPPVPAVAHPIAHTVSVDTQLDLPIGAVGAQFDTLTSQFEAPTISGASQLDGPPVSAVAHPFAHSVFVSSASQLDGPPVFAVAPPSAPVVAAGSDSAAVPDRSLLLACAAVSAFDGGAVSVPDPARPDATSGSTALICSPNSTLRLLTLNIGSLSLHMGALLALVLKESPHICCLQEARIQPHELRAFCHRLRSLGYFAHQNEAHNLITLWRRGVDIVPLQSPPDLQHYRVQLFAIQLKEARALLRHFHYPADNPTNRSHLEDALDCVDRAQNFIDIGDFNSRPRMRNGTVLAFPSSHTFRRNGSAASDFITTIDGARLARHFSRHQCVDALSAIPGLQHRPVRVTLDTAASTSASYRWHVQKPHPGGQLWDSGAKAHLHELAETNIDQAWRFWHEMAGGFSNPSSVQAACPWAAGWAVGAESPELARLLRRIRQAMAKGTRSGDDLADRLLAQTSCLIDHMSQASCRAWRQDMEQRSLAARWLKRRAEQQLEAAHVPNWEPATSAPEDELADPLATLPYLCCGNPRNNSPGLSCKVELRHFYLCPGRLATIIAIVLCTASHYLSGSCSRCLAD